MPHVLREYAFLADGERGIVVGPRGDFAWMCFPRWDSPAVFSSLIGGHGVYAITPREAFVWGGHYEPGGLIWRSRWITREATIECREALALPTQSDRAVILRRVIARSGPARVQVVLGPRGDYGRAPLRKLRRGDDGTWQAEFDGTRVSWTGGADAEPVADGHGGQALRLELELAAGTHHDFVLVLDDRGGDPEPPPEPGRAWQRVEAAWAGVVPAFAETAAPRDSRHAYAVLCGLTSAGGGMVAAATSSLPERARQGRNYDYRYVWIRDQCYAGQAVARAGPHPLLDEAVRFVAGRVLDDGAQLKPAYTTTGGDVPDQHELELPGYPGGSNIIGNWVNKQFQLDALGEVLLLFAAAAGHDHLDAEGWRAAEATVAAIEVRRCDPDAGIWETGEARWTHSRLTCVAGLRQLARRRPAGEQAAQWAALADRIAADTAAHGLHPSGRWQRAFDDPRIDAALLLPGIRGATAPSDPRTIATLRAVEDELTEDGYCYRYRPDERPLGEAEGAFLLCGFFMALAQSQQGDHVAAARWFERTRAACGPPGLCSEEFDVSQRQLRGNLPQAFVHALLLECAVDQGDP